MTTAVEQYRALVAKLEAINPSEPPAPLVVPVELEKPVSEGGYAPAGLTAAPQAPEVEPTPAPTTNEIPTLSGSFKQAYAEAIKQGLKTFKWCGTYSTQGQGPKPAPKPSAVQPRFASQGPSDAVLKDKNGKPLPKANQDLIRKSYDDSSSAGGAYG
jgi:hypothetical protein